MITDFTAYHREYYYVRRARIIEYLGGVCAECGTTENLEIDHVSREDKAFSISKNLTLSNPAVQEELSKCQLLCEEHHLAKTVKENEGFTHGTLYGWMKKKCECDPCYTAKREWHDRRNERRRAGVV